MRRQPPATSQRLTPDDQPPVCVVVVVDDGSRFLWRIFDLNIILDFSSQHTFTESLPLVVVVVGL